MNKDSTWSVKDWIKAPGRMWNRIEMQMQFTIKSAKLKRKKMIPTTSSQFDRYGTSTLLVGLLKWPKGDAHNPYTHEENLRFRRLPVKP